MYICAESITFHRGTSSGYCIRDESFNWPCLAKNHPGSTCGAWKTFSCNYESVGVRLPLAINVWLCRAECEVNWEWAPLTSVRCRRFDMPNRVLFIIMCSALFSPNARAAILMILIMLIKKYDALIKDHYLFCEWPQCLPPRVLCYTKILSLSIVWHVEILYIFSTYIINKEKSLNNLESDSVA